MTETQTDSKAINTEAASELAASERVAGHSVYTYESAGIAERQGNVPAWLWAVVALLLIWGFYYLVAYWNAPITPT